MPGPTKRKEKKPKEKKETQRQRHRRELAEQHKQYGTKTARDRAKEAYVEKRLKRSKESSKKFSKEHPVMSKIGKGMDFIFGQGSDKGKRKALRANFEHVYKTGGKRFTDMMIEGKLKRKQAGGSMNTGRENLLEEEGRIDAERMDPNRRAEKRRVIGELNRGFAKGGAPKKQTKQTRQESAYAKARKRKPSGRLNVDDLKRAKGMSPGIGSFTKRRKILSTGAFKKAVEMMKKLKESRKKLSPHQEAKHSKLRHMMDQPRKKKVVSPHRKQTKLEKLMSGAGKQRVPKPRSPIKKQRGGSMGGGMNPSGWSPDPTVRSVTGYDGGGKVAGRLATRGYGKARR